MTATTEGSTLPRTTHPLVYAVLELRVPFSPKFGAQDSAQRLAEILADTLPVLREEPQQRVTASSDGSMTVKNEPGWRLLNIESTKSCVLTTTSLRYETTRYAGFEGFQSEVLTLLAAVDQVCPPVGYDRLGLRYVNEVRPAGVITRFSDWGQCIAPSYINALDDAACAPVAAAPEPSDCQLLSAESVLQFALPENAAMTLRLVNLEGTGIVGNDPLRRYQIAPPGPFFVVDFDGYWPREPAEIEPYTSDKVLEQMTKVHAPVRSSFRWATTGNYREEAGVVNHK